MLTDIVIFALVAFVSYGCYQYYTNHKFDGKYSYTYIHVFEHYEQDSMPLTNDRLDKTFDHFYNNYTLDDAYNDENLNQSVENHKSKSMTYEKYTELFVNACSIKLLDHGLCILENEKKNVQKLLAEKLSKFVDDAKKIRNGKISIECDRDFLEYKIELQSMMFEIIKTIFHSQKGFFEFSKEKFLKLICRILKDCSFNTNAANDYFFGVRFYLGEKKQILQSKLKKMNLQLQNNFYNHCILDLTYVYLEKIAYILKFLRHKSIFEQRKKIAICQKEVVEIMDDTFVISLMAINELKHCKKQRFTIVFDVFMLLEFAAIRDCSDDTYKLISSSLIEIANGIKTTVHAKKENFGSFLVEVLDIGDLINLKLLSHMCTYLIFPNIKKHIKYNSAADKNKLATLKELENFGRPSRWCFDGSLFDSLVGSDNDTTGSSDIDRILTIYHEKSKLIMDTCSKCKGKDASLCKNCTVIIEQLKHICLLSRHYRSLLERKTKLYYYQNLDDLVKYGKEDEDKALQKQKETELSNIVRDLPATELAVDNQEVTNDKSESKEGFEFSKCGVAQSKGIKEYKNLITRKVKRKHKT